MTSLRERRERKKEEIGQREAKRREVHGRW